MSKRCRNKPKRKAKKRSCDTRRNRSAKIMKAEISPNNIYRCHRMACAQLAKWIVAVSDKGKQSLIQITEALEERGIYYLIGFLFGCGVLLMKGVTPRFNRLLADANLILLSVTLILGTLLFQGHKKVAVRQVSLKALIFVLATAVLILVHGLFHNLY